MHIVLVAGLPGSGKTTWCERVAQNRAGCVVVDDPSRDVARFNQIGPDTKIVLIADPHLCMMNGAEARSWVEKFWAPPAGATWHGLWFDNDPKTCAAHARPKTDNFIQSEFMTFGFGFCPCRADGHTPDTTLLMC